MPKNNYIFWIAINRVKYDNWYLSLVIIIGLIFFQPVRSLGHDWPMWRYNAGRCSSSPEQLPAKMHLQWTRELAPPKPAWPKSQHRLQFDASYEPVVSGKTIFIGSMVSDSVTAYDTETGKKKWRFYTEGPVRFAPIVYKDKLYFASDDGYLYCLDAKNGSLIRKFLGGPADKKVIGNDRLISMWPMRGGPVLYEDKIYFAASIWPFMGIFIYAIDAETGDIIWTNSGSGETYLLQPHSSPAFAGVAPQGYLVATEDKLLISGGRSIPAAYDRKTGQFLYYHLNKYGKTGACDVIASGNHFFNCGATYKLSDGFATRGLPASAIDNDVIIGKTYDSIMAYKFASTGKIKRLWNTEAPSELNRIYLKAGSRLYGSGKEGLILSIDTPVNDNNPKTSWKAKVDGDVWNMLAADGKLFVITLQGKLYCFSDKKTKPRHHVRKIRPLPTGSDKYKEKARQILEITDQREGYCLLLGLGNSKLLYQLINQSELYLIAIDPDPWKIEALRRKLDRAGKYGTRVSIHCGDITTLQLPPYMANLIVIENLKSAGFKKDSIFEKCIYNSLRPYGGTACFLVPQQKHTPIFRRITKLKLPGCKITSSSDFITITRSGSLPDSANWTHQYSDSANTVMSKDKRVKAPLGLLWFGGPSNDKILPRHGHGPSPQVVDGRLFIEGRDMIRAVDVYTGRLLWERQFQDLGKYYDNTSHQPGANEIGSNYVSASDGVYIVYGNNINVLDPATGRTKKEFSLPNENKPQWGTLAVRDNLLLATASPINVPLMDIKSSSEIPENIQPVIEKGSDWKYLAGSHPKDRWTKCDFDTQKWKTSEAGFGYNYNDNKTNLKEMKKRYSAVYIRKSFNIPNPYNISELGLAIKYDDAFIAYLNGKEILRVGVFKGSRARVSGIKEHERKSWEYFRIENHISFLREGQNVLAIEGHNRKIDSLGFTLNPYLLVKQNGEGVLNNNTQQAGLKNLFGITVNADYASGSKMLIAMDRHNGKILWKHNAKYSFRHNTIALGANKVFCIDGMSEAKLGYLKRRGLKVDNERTLYVLDAKTGKTLWKTNQNVFGTWLAYSSEHDVLLEASSRARDRAFDEADRGMVVYRGSDGKILWKHKDSYKGPPILYHNWIITQNTGGTGSAAAEAKAFDILTGKAIVREHPMTGELIPWTWLRFYGCNTAIASENLLTFRSAAGAFIDLTRGQSTATIGGFKSGCTSNLIIANGVLNAPDYTRTCVCSYQNQASLALIHMPEIVHWTFDYYQVPNKATPIKQVGINFGAPGNHYADDNMLWLEFPSIGGPSPDIPIRAKYKNPKWFRSHNSQIKNKCNWITSSGVTGLREVLIRMFIQPGKNSSSVKAFDKHIGQIPTWQEEKITGSFEQLKNYTVRLYFAENAECEVGRRLFNVSLQDKQVLEAFDIIKEAGRINHTVVKEFSSIKIKDDLKVTFTPTTETKADPLLCGIEIVAEDW